MCVSRRDGHGWKELGCESEGRAHGAHIQRRQKCMKSTIDVLLCTGSYSLQDIFKVFNTAPRSHMHTHTHTAAVSVQ